MVQMAGGVSRSIISAILRSVSVRSLPAAMASMISLCASRIAAGESPSLGRVDAVGSGVDAEWLGRDVIALTRFGGYSDVISVALNQVFPQPPSLNGTCS